MATKILIVEDDEELGAMMNDRLRNAGYTCQWCGSGITATEPAATRHRMWS